MPMCTTDHAVVNWTVVSNIHMYVHTQRRSDMRSDYVIVLLMQQLLSLRPDLTFSVFGLVIW